MARHRGMVSPINSVKHYVAQTNFSQTAGGASPIIVADSVVAPAAANTFDVREGSVIKAVHFEYWLMNDGASGQETQFVLIVYKAPSAVAFATFTNMLNLQAWDNKKNILYSTQGILSPQADGSNTVPILRDWILIPKGKQRMGRGDRIIVSIASVETNLRICGLSTYKEYV